MARPLKGPLKVTGDVCPIFREGFGLGTHPTFRQPELPRRAEQVQNAGEARPKRWAVFTVDGLHDFLIRSHSYLSLSIQESRMV